jgi:hypothetical protein
MTTETRQHAAQPRSLGALWLQVLGPPIIWLTQFEAKYALAGKPAARAHPGWLIGISVTAGVLVIALLLGAARSREVARSSALDQMAGVTGRNRFMSVLAAMSCTLFLLLIIAQGLADFFHEPGPS